MLDNAVSRQVMRARQIERAVHDPGPWSVRVGNTSCPARRVKGPDHVTFFAIVRIDAPVTAELRCGEDIVAVRELDAVGHAEIAWEFSIEMAYL